MSGQGLRGPVLVLLTFVLAVMASGYLWHALLGGGPGDGRPGTGQTDASGARGSAGGLLLIRPGWRAEQVAAAVEAAGVGTRARFLELVRDPGALADADSGLIEGPSLEGYLAAGTYAVLPGATEESLISQMLATFDRTYTPDLRRRTQELGLSPRQVVTLASIVEREKVLDSESPIIAGVYWNRLREGMRLEADPTVSYAIAPLVSPGPGSVWRAPPPEALSVDSPYNTYLHPGLPPGPIASPSAATIKAVLYPVPTNRLFFVARDGYSHVFARTFQEHQQNIQQIVSAAAPARAQAGQTLKLLIEHTLEPVVGHAGVLVKNLATGETASFHGDDYFPSGGLDELIVLAYAYDRVQAGALSLDERLTMPPGLTGDRPEVREELGEHPTVAQALSVIATSGSSSAGLALLGRLSPESTSAFARRLGLNDTWLLPTGSYTTPRDIGLLLESATTGQGVDTGASVNILDALLGNQLKDRLANALPAGTTIAHATGSLDYPSHDAGIVFTRAGPVVIVAMTEAVEQKEAATAALAKLGTLVTQYFDGYEPAAAALTGSSGCAGENPFRSSTDGPLSGRTIVLDPGHGGEGEGSDDEIGASFTFPDGTAVTEREVTLQVGLRLKDLLVAQGATVYLSRCQDVGSSVFARAAFANSVAPDLFVSIHTDGAPDPASDGTAVYYFSKASRAAADAMLGTPEAPALWDQLNSTRSLPRLGANRAAYVVVAFTNAPAVLTEAFFLTHPEEAELVRASSGQADGRIDQIVRGHLHGILAYFQSSSSGEPPASAERSQP